MKNIYIIGSKGIPAKYGGFETFVDKLVQNQKSDQIKYHVACTRENSLKSNITEDNFTYHGADCFSIDIPNIGPAKAIYYDVAALNHAIKLAEKNQDTDPIFYILACRIGPFIGSFKKKIEKIGGKLFINPDGHEWMRAKWSYPVRRYWKLSEKLMVKHADLLICDSKNIEKYILEDYKAYHPKTTYIAYGTDVDKSKFDSNSKDVIDWFSQKDVTPDNYYLVVGRFVPENNYETMIREFMKSDSKKDFVLITNVEENKFFDKLKQETGFDKDSRIKFVGTVYNQELLKYIRENAFAYIHGHEVGGTNPSLLEALASTKLNLLLNVGFNREVGEDGALYWDKDNLNLLINDLEKNVTDYSGLEAISKKTIADRFSWDGIVSKYEDLFLKN
ncbi:glycosyltransferase family 1 protein [Streptococcaceae bacterium ESL0729]|nr:glycosyltransferase family 1 protein [Streptococcaceae bacterium ESL0729]